MNAHQDGIHTPFETVLDWRAYAVRVPRDEIGGMRRRLLELSPPAVQAMQLRLSQVWRRFTYGSVVAAERARAAAAGRPQGPGAALAAHGADDAVATLLAELAGRLRLRRARRRAAARRARREPRGGREEPFVGAAAATRAAAVEPPPGCEAREYGDESPALSDKALAALPGSVMRRDFEGRSVNGWAI